MYIYPQNPGLSPQSSQDLQQLMLLGQLSSQQSLASQDPFTPPLSFLPPGVASTRQDGMYQVSNPGESSLPAVVDRLMTSVDYLVTVVGELAQKFLNILSSGPASSLPGQTSLPKSYPPILGGDSFEYPGTGFPPELPSYVSLYPDLQSPQGPFVDPSFLVPQLGFGGVAQPLSQPFSQPAMSGSNWRQVISDAAVQLGLGLAIGGTTKAALAATKFLGGRVVNFAQGAVNGVKAGASWLGSAATKVWNGAKDAVGGIFNAGKDALGSVISSIF